MIRRTLLRSAAALAAMLAGPAFAQPDAYPSKPIKWIVPFPPAGAMDTIARTLGEQMGRKLGPDLRDREPARRRRQHRRRCGGQVARPTATR